MSSNIFKTIPSHQTPPSNTSPQITTMAPPNKGTGVGYYRCNRWGNLHRLEGCLHIIQTPPSNDASKSEPCGTNCVVETSAKRLHGPFLCLQCLEEYCFSQYIAIKDKFAQDNPGTPWPADEAEIAAKIKGLSVQVGDHIVKRLPLVRKCAPYEGPLLTALLDVDTTVGTTGGSGDLAAGEGDADGDSGTTGPPLTPSVNVDTTVGTAGGSGDLAAGEGDLEGDSGTTKPPLAASRDVDTTVDKASGSGDLTAGEGDAVGEGDAASEGDADGDSGTTSTELQPSAALLLVAEVEKLQVELEEVAEGKRTDDFVEKMVSKLQGQVRMFEATGKRNAKKDRRRKSSTQGV
ncbi:hypothetical protein BU16DRAFT_620367 [Lophium mytilinum]|uniref:Uncharacterized protein n=1 Tax=Lophium mytilinum TaxID=390894 RepID=A0A6A6QI74_9PEZI|nr:hypothetical protein BU16DRAFT_620367 [Lophium mytilinum]